MTSKKMYAVKGTEVISNDNFRSPINTASAPINGWYWGLYLHDPWDPIGTVTLDAKIRVTITYYVMFVESNQDVVD